MKLYRQIRENSIIETYFWSSPFVGGSKGKGKVHPITGHVDPKVELGIALPFNLGAKCWWVVNAKPRPLYPQVRDPVPIV